jgi:hypothetical protein
MLKVLNPSLNLPPSIPASLKVSFTGSATFTSASGFPHYYYIRKKFEDL